MMEEPLLVQLARSQVKKQGSHNVVPPGRPHFVAHIPDPLEFEDMRMRFCDIMLNHIHYRDTNSITHNMRQGIVWDFVIVQVPGAGYVIIEDIKTHHVETLVFESDSIDIEGCKGKPVYFQCNESGVLTDLIPVMAPVKVGW